jgi:hypothetical protein
MINQGSVNNTTRIVGKKAPTKYCVFVNTYTNWSAGVGGSGMTVVEIVVEVAVDEVVTGSVALDVGGLRSLMF